MKIRFFIVLLFCGTLLFCAAQGFTDGLSAEELAVLNKHDVVVRYINTPDKIAVRKGIAPQFDCIIDDMIAIDSNYLAEALWSVPVAGYEDLLEQVDALFRTMDTFKEIPYYSETFHKTTQLFTIAEIVHSVTEGTKMLSDARFCMDPFSVYGAALYLEKTDQAFIFTHKNTDALKIAGIHMVAKERMRAGIAVVRDGERWIVYAAGGVKAPKPALFKNSLETAFNNRIKDFAVFYIKKVKR